MMKTKRNNLFVQRRKICALALAMLLISMFAFAGCGGSQGGSGGSNAQTEFLTGSAEEILSQIMENATEDLGEENPMPMTFTDPISSDSSQGMLGITSEAFDQYVDEAASATGALITTAFQAAVVKCKDPVTADEAKTVIADNFDSFKWICVFPEQSLVMNAGSYVLLAVGTVAETDAISRAFDEAAGGNASEANVFFRQADHVDEINDLLDENAGELLN